MPSASAIRVTATIPPLHRDRLCWMEFVTNSLTSRTAVEVDGQSRPSRPAVKARTPLTTSGRPGTVTLPSTEAYAINPNLPSRSTPGPQAAAVLSSVALIGSNQSIMTGRAQSPADDHCQTQPGLPAPCGTHYTDGSPDMKFRCVNSRKWPALSSVAVMKRAVRAEPGR